MDDIRLDGNVAVVTGATGGWGSGAAFALAARGAAVVLNSRTQAKLDVLADRLRRLGGQAIGVAQDVRTMDGARSVIEAGIEAFGRIDILVNSTGATSADVPGDGAPAQNRRAIWGGGLLDMTAESWDAVIASELRAVFTCAKAAATQMVKQGGGGRIITVAGGGGMFGMPGASAHAAAKGGVASATWSWSDELQPYGITVNATRGWVRSALNDPSWSVDDQQVERMPGRGFEAFVQAAPLVVWLASSGAADVTGVYLGIDGPRITIWEAKPPDMAVFNYPHWTAEELAVRLGPIIHRRPPRTRLPELTADLADTAPS